MRAGDRAELRSAACQHCRCNAANALILGTLFIFCPCLYVRRLADSMSESEDVMASRQLAAKELASRDFRRQLDGYGLTTAQILYRLPHHPSPLHTHICQNNT